MKLHTKINLYTSVMFILLLVLVNSAIYFSFNRLMLNHELERTGAEALKTVEGMNKANTEINIRDLLKAYVPVNGMVKIVETNGKSDITITDPNQKHLIERPTSYYGKEIKKIIQYKKLPHTFISIPIITRDGRIANLQMTESLEGTAHILSILRIVLITITMIATIPVLLSSRILSNFISRPILTMIQTMAEIRKSGKYNRISLPKKSNDELSIMGETFNAMIDQLEINYERQEQFVMSASHELKTPLTIIESYASLLKRRGLQQPDLFYESVEAIHSEAIRMRELTQQLLLLAKHEEKWNIVAQMVNLEEVAADTIQSFGTAFGREIVLKVRARITVYTDKERLKQIIYILMENACKYSEAPITIQIDREGDKGLIEILDRGIGIPSSDISKVFDRFYRVDTARTRKTGGFGLGLSLAKEIADAINVQIKLLSEEGKGTTAQIHLHLADSN
ncbi:sensor histidine kinase [Lederbergia panacisoli]|uniref:sensor histidine kinase n=1 Tax=Lederbergia panacisoli TaxID=1255251 RepID=UPI00214C44E9|nr:HAMP domain-containing sensor histidine kinase [Lederbergia panacisoli]MCR2821660.1 HAMP domain-containing histidine kinase [Lederbergia panacisoli]